MRTNLILRSNNLLHNKIYYIEIRKLSFFLICYYYLGFEIGSFKFYKTFLITLLLRYLAVFMGGWNFAPVRKEEVF